MPVHGRHQLVNLAAAIASVEALTGRKLDDEAVADAAAAVTLPGRMEPIWTNPLVLLDGAHNSDGLATLAASLEEEFPTARWQVVLGVVRSGPVGGIQRDPVNFDRRVFLHERRNALPDGNGRATVGARGR